MRQSILFAVALAGCHTYGTAYRYAPAVQPSWHWPCDASMRVATSVDDPDEFHLATRRAIAKINQAAQRDLLRYVGRLAQVPTVGITMVRLRAGDSAGGAMPIYSVSGQCIAKWEVRVDPSMRHLDLILLHELGHVAGLEHVKGTVMEWVQDGHREPLLGPMLSGVVRCMAEAVEAGRGRENRYRHLSPFEVCTGMGAKP